MWAFLFWTKKVLMKAKSRMSFWEVYKTQRSTTLERFGQERCILLIIFIPTPLHFGKNNSTGFTQKCPSQEYGLTWMSHPTLEETNQPSSTIKSSSPSLSIKWQSMSTSNTTVLLIRKTHSPIGKSTLTTAILPQFLLMIS